MSVTLDTAVSGLKAGSIYDPSTHLKPKGRDELAAEIDRFASRGLRAHVLIVDLGDPFEELMHAFDKLGYDAEHDLLLIFNTRDWVARGWGLSTAEIQRGLDAARPHQRTVFAKELIDALDALARIAGDRVGTTATGEAKHEGGGFPTLPVVGGIAVVGIGGLVGLAIMRRGRLAKEGGAALADAKASAERAYTDLILACEEVPGTDTTNIQLKATELKKRMDAVVAEVTAAPHKGTDPVVIGKLRQFENELAALRSTVIQKENA